MPLTVEMCKSYVPQLFGLFRHIMINQHYSRWFALYLAPYAHPPQSRSTAPPQVYLCRCKVPVFNYD